MIKQSVPRELITEQDRFFWRLDNIEVVRGAGGCYFLDWNNSAARLYPGVNGEPRYSKRGHRSAVSLARAILCFLVDTAVELDDSSVVTYFTCGNRECLNPDHIQPEPREARIQRANRNRTSS